MDVCTGHWSTCVCSRSLHCSVNEGLLSATAVPLQLSIILIAQTRAHELFQSLIKDY